MATDEPLRIRLAHGGDAAVVAAMANALNVHEGKAPGVHTAASVWRDLLSHPEHFTTLVADRAGKVVGYLVFHPTWNSDLGGRGIWAVDAYVDPSERGGGVGRALFASMAAHAVAQGCVSVWWAVRTPNEAARRFYASLGAREEDVREIELDGDALRRLAAEGSTGHLFHVERGELADDAAPHVARVAGDRTAVRPRQ